jgi:hypothetical protein
VLGDTQGNWSQSPIDFLICIQSIVLWPNLGKMTTKFCFRATPLEPLGGWYAIVRDDRGYDVGVQHVSHFLIM